MLTSFPSDPAISQGSLPIPMVLLTKGGPLHVWEPLLSRSFPWAVPVLSCLHFSSPSLLPVFHLVDQGFPHQCLVGALAVRRRELCILLLCSLDYDCQFHTLIAIEYNHMREIKWRINRCKALIHSLNFNWQHRMHKISQALYLFQKTLKWIKWRSHSTLIIFNLYMQKQVISARWYG